MPRPYGSRDSQEREYVAPLRHANRRGLVRLSPMVPAEVHKQAYSNAKAAGVSMGRYIAELIRRDQVDQAGVPVWAREVFGEDGRQEEFPITG